MGTTEHLRSSLDEALLTKTLRDDRVGLQAEQFNSDSHEYLNALIPKPWGHEFRVYADDLYDVWKLCLHPGEATSTHCHPRKQTVLLCLAGSATLSVLDGEQTVSAGDFAVLNTGVFHGTENTGDTDLHLIEVEVPRNKLDLVRSGDRYGRKGTGYETTNIDSIPDLKISKLIPNARLRPPEPIDGFEFGIRAGLDLITRPHRGLLFAVSLGVADALDHTVTVLPGWLAPHAVTHEGLYLTIGRIEAEMPG